MSVDSAVLTASGDAAPAPGRPSWRRLAAIWCLPAMVVLSVAVLTFLELNGSSLAIDGAHWPTDTNLIAGAPRGIRSDEYRVSTPNLIGNDRRGLPVQPWVGLTATFLPATGWLSSHWSEAFKPQDWGFFVLPTSNAFALRWWSTIGFGLLGVFGMLFALSRAVALSAGLTIFVVLSPVTAWWSDAPALLYGWAAAIIACVVMALRSPRTRAAVLWSVAAGYFALAEFMLLYPPWLITLAWIGVGVGVGTAIDVRAGIKRVLLVVAVLLVVVVPVVAAWSIEGRAAIQATAQTDYPGDRLSPSGGGTLGWLLDAPTSAWFSAAKPLELRTTGVHANNGASLYVNVSEVSSPWLPLPLVLVAVIALIWLALRARRDGRPPTVDAAQAAGSAATDPAGSLVWTGICTACAFGLLLAWALLPLPAVFGSLTLLSRVPGYRAGLALGFGVLPILAVLATLLRRRRPPGWLVVLLGAGAVASTLAWYWGSRSLPWLHRGPSSAKVLLIAAVVSICLAFVLSGRGSGAAALALGAVSMATFLPVNPLYRGLGPLESDPLVVALEPYGRPGAAARVAVYDAALVPLVTASGVQTLTGVTPYPDRQLWQALDPEQMSIWNNYGKYDWIADPTLSTPVLRRVGGSTHLIMRINPCAPSTRSVVNVELSVTSTPLDLPCLDLVRTVQRPLGRTSGVVYIYRTRPAP